MRLDLLAMVVVVLIELAIVAAMIVMATTRGRPAGAVDSAALPFSGVSTLAGIAVSSNGVLEQSTT